MPTQKKLTKEELKRFNNLFQKVIDIRSNLASKTLDKETQLRNLKNQKHLIKASYDTEFTKSNSEINILNSKISDFVNEMNEKLGGKFTYNPITGEILEENK